MTRTEIQRARESEDAIPHRISWLLDFFGVVLDDNWRNKGFWVAYEGRLDVLYYEAQKGYKAMVRKLHPDSGTGDSSRMAQVNAAWGRLETAFRKHGWKG